MYLFQFRIKMFHRSDKSNMIFDVLFRLSIIRHKIEKFAMNSLDVNDFNTNEIDKLNDVLIEMNKKFRFKLKQNYQKDVI